MLYWTNFVINNATNRVALAIDYKNPADSIRAAIEMADAEHRVERVGPLNTCSLFETQVEYDPVIDRVAY